MATLRAREEKLKKKWNGINDMVPVNQIQYFFVDEKKEERFFQNIYPDKKDREIYNKYREEWYRRAKEFDPGSFPLSVSIELVSTSHLPLRCLFYPVEVRIILFLRAAIHFYYLYYFSNSDVIH